MDWSKQFLSSPPPQVKVVVMALLVQYDIAYPEGQTDQPGDVILGEERTHGSDAADGVKEVKPSSVVVSDMQSCDEDTVEWIINHTHTTQIISRKHGKTSNNHKRCL